MSANATKRTPVGSAPSNRGLAADDAGLRAWRGLLEAHASLVTVLSRELEAETGLPLTHYEVLHRLCGSPDGQMKMQDLADSILLSKSGVTRVVDRMIDSGLVERRACLTDRRIIWAGVTSAGRRAFLAAESVHLRGVEEHFSSRISDQQARSLAASLSRITDPGSRSCPE
jgi:DNA-binding MarR family transcriptional regulator